MAGDIHHVIHAAEQPVVAFIVNLAAIAGEVAARIARPVLLNVALGVAVNRSQHRGPGLGQHQVAAGARPDFLARCVHHLRRNPGNGRVAEPGLVATIPGSGVIRIEPVSVCHQVSTIGQRSWPILT